GPTSARWPSRPPQNSPWASAAAWGRRRAERQAAHLPVLRLLAPAIGEVLPRLSNAARARARQRARSVGAPAQGSQDQAAVFRRPAGEGRLREQPARGRADRGAAFGGGHPQHVAPRGWL